MGCLIPFGFGQVSGCRSRVATAFQGIPQIEVFDKRLEDLKGKCEQVGLSLKLVLWGKDGFGLRTFVFFRVFPPWILRMFYDVEILLPLLNKFCILCWSFSMGRAVGCWSGSLLGCPQRQAPRAPHPACSCQALSSSTSLKSRGGRVSIGSGSLSRRIVP